MIEDIAWFETGNYIQVNGAVKMEKVLKVRINGEWHIVPTIPFNKVVTKE